MTTKGRRILVADDQPLITQTVCEALEMMGYRPCAVFNGKQALEEVERELPDLVVLDVIMPIMDGFEVLKFLRSRQNTRDVPVIMLTALDSDKDILQGIRSGATMYLTKPVEVGKLTKLVSAILGSTPASVAVA